MCIMNSVMGKKTYDNAIIAITNYMKKDYRRTEEGGIPFSWSQRKRVIDGFTKQMTLKIDLKVNE